MKKIYFTVDGWVCDRYPTDLPVDDENRFIEVSDEKYADTMTTTLGMAWRVKDGVLINDVYDKQDFKLNETELERTKLKQELEKIKEDVEQVELFGMERSDYTQKKTRCVEIIERLRVLEQRLKEWSKEGN